MAGQQLVVVDVMQDAGVGTAGDDRGIGMSVGSASAKLIGEFGLEFVFGHSRSAGAHGADVASRGDVRGLAHGVDLVRILGQSHLVENAPQVADFVWCARAVAALGAHRIQCVGDSLVPVRVVTERVPERAAVGEQFGQHPFEAGNRIRLGKIESLTRRLGSVAEAVPGLALFVLFSAEQYRFRLRATDENDHGIGFGKAAEIPEIAVEAVGIVRVPVAHALRCRGDDGDTVTDLRQQLLTAPDVVVMVHEDGTSSLSSSARRSGVPTSTQRPLCRSPRINPRAIAWSSRGRSFITVPGRTPAKKDGENIPMPA